MRVVFMIEVEDIAFLCCCLMCDCERLCPLRSTSAVFFSFCSLSNVLVGRFDLVLLWLEGATKCDGIDYSRQKDMLQNKVR